MSSERFKRRSGKSSHRKQFIRILSGQNYLVAEANRVERRSRQSSAKADAMLTPTAFLRQLQPLFPLETAGVVMHSVEIIAEDFALLDEHHRRAASGHDSQAK